MARTSPAQLAGRPQLLAFFRKLLDLVSVVQPGPLGDLLGPDFAPDGHPSDVRSRAAVDVRRLGRRAKLLRWQSDRHLHSPGV